jgi:DNA repair protein RadC
MGRYRRRDGTAKTIVAGARPIRFQSTAPLPAVEALAGGLPINADAVYDRKVIQCSRPDARERLAREGAASLADRDLLAALLGTGMRGKGVFSVADEVLALIDGLTGPPDAELLARVPGIGRAKASAVAAALELGRRLYGLRDRRIASPRDVWPLIAHWADRKQERFICCSLNGAHEVIAARVVSVGLVNRTVVHPREVFADPLQDRACAVMVDETEIPVVWKY